MNKKGLAQMFWFLIVIVAILFVMFASGGITSLILKSTFRKIPTWFWVGLVIFILIVLLRRKNK